MMLATRQHEDGADHTNPDHTDLPPLDVGRHEGIWVLETPRHALYDGICGRLRPKEPGTDDMRTFEGHFREEHFVLVRIFGLPPFSPFFGRFSHSK